MDVGEDGTFRLDNVPPGDWDLLTLATITNLEEGETRTVAFDLSEHRVATVTGRALLNGKPLAESRFSLDQGLWRRQGWSFGAFDAYQLDESGGFRIKLPPGQPYRPRIHLKDSEPGRSYALIPPEFFTMAPGEVLERDFHFLSRPLRVRVLSSDGSTPVGGITMRAHPLWKTSYANTATTDDQGWVHFEHLWPGEIFVKLWPKNLATPEARQVYQSQTGSRAEELSLGPIHLPQGVDAVEAQIVLTRESGY